ncbi:MAG: hypothetical protein APF77_18430 [Clostridia bacterium BRH_c25]|nr:MAG: hypothetical protein APF77_18430 [Clostridia bacterium BRH_c25]
MIYLNRHTVPNLTLKQLNRISPSKYFSLQACILREVWSADNQTKGLLPVAPIIKIGTVAHKVLELAAKGLVKTEEDAVKQWDIGVKATEEEMNSSWLEKHLLPLSKKARYYEVKRQQCLIMVRSILGRGSGKGIIRPSSIKVEVWVESSNGKVAGKIDVVRQTSEGVQIVDYKTGAVLEINADADEIKLEYQLQLKIYAALYNEKYGNWPEHLVILTLGHKEYEIPFTKKECKNLLEKASARLDEVNAMIASAHSVKELANPTPDNCRYCTFRPACEVYWTTRDLTGLWPIDCYGRVIDLKVLNNGSLRVTINNGSDNVVIRGLDPKRHEGFQYNASEVFFYNLNVDSVSGYYTESLLTTCYCK